jgi:hypothetical protein
MTKILLIIYSSMKRNKSKKYHLNQKVTFCLKNNNILDYYIVYTNYDNKKMSKKNYEYVKKE